MKKFLSVVGGIICVIICLILFIFQILFIGFNSAKLMVTKNSIKEAINNINVRQLISENPKDVSEIYGAFDTLGFSVEETNEILDSKSIKEFLTNYIYNNIDNIINDKNSFLEFKDIEKLINDIEQEKNIKLKNKEMFLKLAKNEYPKIQKSINFANDIKDNTDKETLEVFKIIMGKTLLIAFVVVFTIIYLLICLFRWSIYKPLIWYGITTIISSFFTLIGFLNITILNSINNEDIEKLKPILSPVLKVLKTKGIIISGICLAIGILMVVIFSLINKKINNQNDIETKLETL